MDFGDNVFEVLAQSTHPNMPVLLMVNCLKHVRSKKVQDKVDPLLPLLFILVLELLNGDIR